MSGPPPPPPPGGMPPPMFVARSPSKNAGVERDALLRSIQKGKALKKTVTVDKSGPYIAGNASKASGNSVGNSGKDRPTPSSGPPNGLVGLGSLFPGGQIPKLRSVEGANNSHSSSNGHSNSNHRLADNNLQKKHTQNEIKKRMANDNKNRGPPPPAPTRNMNQEDSTTPRKFQLPPPLEDQQTPRKLQLPTSRNGSSNHMQTKPVSTCDLTNAGHEPNRSSLHKRAVSNSSIGSDNIDSIRNKSSFGKPNVAPKPPVLNGKMKPLNRTQSMKNPRSPSPQSPSMEKTINFGTMIKVKPELKETLAAMHQTSKQRPPLNERPKAPPPSVPQSFNAGQFGPNKSIKHPEHAPPPPPPSMVQAQHQAPPVPPHRIAPHVPPRSAAPLPPTMSSNGNTAPPPPPRVYSMKDNNSLSRQTSSASASSPSDFESRFKFHDIGHLTPIPYKNVPKVYPGKQVSTP